MKGWIIARATLAIAATALLVGCGSAPKPESGPAKIEKPRDTAQIAEEIIGGRVGMLLYMDRVRGTPLGEKLDVEYRWRAWWKGTELDPQRDIERVFGAAPALDKPENSIWVTEVNVPLTKVKSGLDVMLKSGRLKGEWLTGAKMPEAKVELRDGTTRLIGLVEPRWIVMLPPEHEKDLARFEKSGGFPDPIGAEAMVVFAFNPAKTLVGPRAQFALPPTVELGVATITLTVDGGAEIGVDALSPNAEQARKDAATMTRLIDDATSIKVSSLKVHFVDPIVFRADGQHVRGRRTVPASEIEQALAFDRIRRRALSRAEPAPTEKTEAPEAVPARP
jgi:hypothetical protein